MKLFIGFIISLLLFPTLSSCTEKGSSDKDNIEMDDAVGLPKNVSDFNRYISDSLDYNNVVDKVYEMLNYKPEESFRYPFEYAENRASLKTITTPDSLMRFYSFSLPYFDDDITLIQYRNFSGLHSDFLRPDDDVKDFGVFVSDVYTLRNDFEQTVYLIHCIGSDVPNEANHRIIGVTMTDEGLTEIPIFNTGTKRLYEIASFIVYYHSDKWANGDKIYRYDEKDQTLYIPLIEDDEFQDKFLIYKFNGLEFKYSGIR